jgi:pyruvate kinase
MRSTKLIVSLGPATCDMDTIRRACLAGMDMARLNLSHKDHAWHAGIIRSVRKASAELGRPIPIEVDVQGPSVRTGMVSPSDGFLHLTRGQELLLTVDGAEPGSGRISVLHPDFIRLISEGSMIYIDDAFVKLRVLETNGTEARCVVLNDCLLGNRRTVHVPGLDFGLPTLREKDWKDIEFCVREGADFIGVSFVRSAKDILDVREFLAGRGGKAGIIAKIETAEGIADIDAIIRAADAVMIARGDMGVKLPLEQVPVHQYSIIRKCKEAGRFVITATEMLNSMKSQQLPTRAEVNDVFTAVAAGSDAVMLSGETAEGLYPIEAIEQMARIVESAESSVAGFRIDLVEKPRP